MTSDFDSENVYGFLGMSRVRIESAEKIRRVSAIFSKNQKLHC